MQIKIYWESESMGTNCMPCQGQNNFLLLFLFMMLFSNQSCDNSFMFIILLFMFMQPGFSF